MKTSLTPQLFVEALQQFSIEELSRSLILEPDVASLSKKLHALSATVIRNMPKMKSISEPGRTMHASAFFDELAELSDSPLIRLFSDAFDVRKTKKFLYVNILRVINRTEVLRQIATQNLRFYYICSYLNLSCIDFPCPLNTDNTCTDLPENEKFNCVGISTKGFKLENFLTEKSKGFDKLIHKRTYIDQSPLGIAIEDDDVDQLINLAADPKFSFDSRINIGQSALAVNVCSCIHFAALLGSIRVFRFLMINGAQLKSPANPDQKFPTMRFAIAGGSEEIIQIFEENGINIENGCLGIALAFHRNQIVSWLIETKHLPILYDSYLSAVQAANYRGLSILFQNGLSPSQTFPKTDHPVTYLMKKHDFEVIRFLVLNKLSINEVYLKNETLLTMACSSGNFEFVRFLVENGADVNIGPNGSFPLCCGIQYPEIVRFLLQNGAFLTTTSQQGFTLLHLAVGSIPVMKILIDEYHVPIDVQVQQQTPLAQCVTIGHAKFLLEKGADKDISPLIAISLERKLFDLAKFYIVEAKCDPNQTHKSILPLSLAIKSLRIDIVSLLLDRLPPLQGGDMLRLLQRDFFAEGQTSGLDHLTTKGHILGDHILQFLQVLVDHGGNVNDMNNENTVCSIIISRLSARNSAKCYQAVRFLLDHNANPIVPKGDCLLSRVISNTHGEYLMKLVIDLVSAGAPVNPDGNTSCNGRHPLVKAILGQEYDVASYLLEHGAAEILDTHLIGVQPPQKTPQNLTVREFIQMKAPDFVLP